MGKHGLAGLTFLFLLPSFVGGCAGEPRELTAEDWLAKVPPPQGLSDQEYLDRARQFALDFVKSRYFAALQSPWVPAEVDPFGELVPDFGPIGTWGTWLYPDGNPAYIQVETRDDSPVVRILIKWYSSGRPMLVEKFVGDRLMEGRYYKADGALLGQVVKGTGTSFEMATNYSVVYAGWTGGMRQYADGLLISEKPGPNGEMQPRDAGISTFEWPTEPPDDLAGSYVAPPGLVVFRQIEGGGANWMVAVRRADNALLKSDDGGKTWTLVRKGFGFEPRGVTVVDNGRKISIWGWLKTEHPERGIPARAEYTLDGGKTWRTFDSPGSYTLRMGVSSEGFQAECRLLPRDGLAKNQHWWFLNEWWFVSLDGKRWIRGYQWNWKRGEDRISVAPDRTKFVCVRATVQYKGALRL